MEVMTVILFLVFCVFFVLSVFGNSFSKSNTIAVICTGGALCIGAILMLICDHMAKNSTCMSENISLDEMYERCVLENNNSTNCMQQLEEQ